MIGWMLALWCAAPSAAAPVTIQHQARLLDAAGGPLEGAHRLELRLYRGDGAQVWADVFDPVQADGGYISVVLGGGAPLDGDLFAEALWLGVAVDGGPELPLRQALHTVPRAAWAGRAAAADAIVGGSVQLGPDDTPCAPALAGRLRFESAAVQVCDGQAWVGVGGGRNGTIAAPGSSCRQLHLDYPSLASDVYYIDPNGGSPADAFPVYCEMDLADGGWTRVATLATGVSVCSLTQALGTPADVANGIGTAWLSADAVGQIEWPDREILIVDRPANWIRYTSANAGFTWANVANGTLRSSNVGSYGIRFRRNDESSFSNLQSVTNSCNSNGNCLLGGYDASSRWTIILGIGGYGRNNLFAQDSTCQTHPSTSPHRALYSGRYSDQWNQDGQVYIR